MAFGSMKSKKITYDTTTAAPPRPEPPKLDTTSPAFGEISRFVPADISMWGEWLLARIQERWPQWQRQTLSGRLMGFINSNQFLFIKSGEAIGLAMVSHDPMDSRPIVREVFLWLLNDENKAHGFKIVKEFQRWAKQLQAKRLDLWICNDLPCEEVKKAVDGEIYEEVFIDLTKAKAA